MSAYALPGLLFPPVEFEKATGSSSTANSTKPTVSLGEQVSSSSRPSSDKTSNQHHSDETNTQLSTSTRRRTEMSYCGSLKSASSMSHGPILFVKRATLDPVRLVRSLTRKASRRLYPSSRSRRDRCKMVDKVPSTDKAVVSSSPSYEDAVQFEISVSFNGRKYTATRTLPSIKALRNDLIREMQIRQESIQNQLQRHSHLLPSGPGADVTDDTSVVEDLTDNDTASTSRDSSKGSQHEEDPDHVFIPELPPFSEDSAGSASETSTSSRVGQSRNNRPPTHPSDSFVACGFTMIHVYIKSYCPALETWFSHITEFVPSDSPTLTNFLWEPLGGENAGSNTPLPSSSHRRARQSSIASSLGSIQEIESSEEDSSEEEESESEES